jgi:hypothetical protein
MLIAIRPRAGCWSVWCSDRGMPVLCFGGVTASGETSYLDVLEPYVSPGGLIRLGV